MGNQRGSIGMYLLFSVVAAGAAGYGVYALLHDRRSAAADEVGTPAPGPVPAAAPRPVPATPASAVDVPRPVDTAERDAVAPADIDDPVTDTVLLGTPGVAGAIDAASVEREVKRYLVRYARCMRKTHKHYYMRRGSLRVTLAIAANGAVESATGTRKDVEDELAECVLGTLQKLRFDKPRDGGTAKVVYPIAFVPAQGGNAGDRYPAGPPGASSGDPLGL